MIYPSVCSLSLLMVLLTVTALAVLYYQKKVEQEDSVNTFNKRGYRKENYQNA